MAFRVKLDRLVLFSFSWAGTALESITADLYQSIGYYCKDRPALKLSNDHPNHEFTFSWKFGTKGEEPGQFGWPDGIAVDPNTGNLAVADTHNHRVQVFTSDGTFLHQFGTETRPQHLLAPCAVLYDGLGHLLVADREQNWIRIHKIDDDYALVNIIGGDSSFLSPWGLALDIDGNYLICDNGHGLLHIYTPKGEKVKTIGSKGAGVGQLTGPTGVCVDMDGNYLISEWGNHRLQLFDRDGKSLRILGAKGKADGELLNPWGLTVDGNNTVIVSDNTNNRIVMMTIEGKFLRKITDVPLPSSLRLPTGVVVNQDGQLIVVDYSNHRVLAFD